ncbi:MAG: hypothetical protein K5668_10215 [Lachnospiraceae bacterium]|nr:hypothetical protein [Lachnospiraceae bacterium]
MGLDDRLFKDQKKAVENAAKPDPYYESEPTGLMYKDREGTVPLDSYKGVFSYEDKKSLNTRPSIFDSTAVFKVSAKKDNEA